MQKLLVVTLLCCCAVASQAQADDVDYSQNPRVPQLLERLREDDGFSEAQLKQVTDALADAKRLPQLIVQEQKAPERTETWTQYSKRVDTSRIRAGIALLQDQRDTLERAEEEFGVPPAVIAGILGIETRYGRITGGVRVLDALATQGFEHPTRSKFFFSELVEFFALCRDQHFDPRQPKGSYAGAMGDAQFMPSNYRRLALDYDGDGQADLWSLPDAIGSIANYFTHYDPDWRWRAGQPIAVPATIHGDALPDGAVANTRDHFYYVRDLEHAGIKPAVDLPGDTVVGLVDLLLDGGGHEYWLAFPNFYAIMTYNPRIYYAMAVTQLARRIEAEASASP
ncbi:lytic murein transglycosylase B [Solimonas marina]|uniref:Lytic murein transglycosylase B n=1 Tax=Solimonas marina TaxID=2714601 RepID=A0A969WFN2_9GAMM|nr:lytic murein transglycosylase B [Solimonas marina]NKF23865.1 lytic murein transglycosylase B [Solimonas marina]